MRCDTPTGEKTCAALKGAVSDRWEANNIPVVDTSHRISRPNRATMVSAQRPYLLRATALGQPNVETDHL